MYNGGIRTLQKSIMLERSIAFSVRIIKLHNFLTQEKREYIISKQIFRCGTSIGANISEANYAQSKADFISKLHIAAKECGETEYWLRVLCDSGLISKKSFESIIKDCLDLKHMLLALLNTSKKSSEQN